MAPPSGTTNVDSSLSKLSISAPSRTEKDVVESWDDADSANSEDENHVEAPKKSGHLSNPSASYPSAPPPTPMSPKFSNTPNFAGSDFPGFEDSQSAPDAASERRPEKSTQTASRMIAAGLGIKAPKRTEEQKQYDKAVREKEAKRINQQREDKRRQEEEREKAKAAMWDG